MFLKINFKETGSLYYAYIQHAKRNNIELNKELIREVGRRLKQLSILMEIIAQLTVRESNSKNSNIPSNELWMYVESFYYLAFRTRNVIKRLPGLSSFDCPGIRNVRNHLLEHPENKNSGILTESFSWGKASGPVIKVRRKEIERRIFPDAGLYANYLEFQEKLKLLLEKRVLK
jgi:hypothetical protein